MTETIHEALFKLQGMLRGVKKDAKNSHFKTSYATLEQVTDTIRTPMQELGLYWSQNPGKIIDGSIEVTTEIVHWKTGVSKTFTAEMPLAKRDPQGAGSALTYCCRYSLMAALGLPPTDDDAETAIDRNNVREEPENPKSSAQLKRDGEWERVSREVAEAMNDISTFGQFERLKESYRQEAHKNGWNKTFLAQLGELFMGYEADVQKKIDDDNARTHPMNAG